MVEFVFDPPITAKTAEGPFGQQITILDNGKQIGLARWHCDAVEGLMQVLDLTISSDHRRNKLGTRMLHTAIEQARQLHRFRKTKIRRVWFGLAQKTEVVGRSFLTSCGFQHVGTMNGLFRDQDLMFYVKSLD